MKRTFYASYLRSDGITVLYRFPSAKLRNEFAYLEQVKSTTRKEADATKNIRVCFTYEGKTEDNEFVFNCYAR